MGLVGWSSSGGLLASGGSGQQRCCGIRVWAQHRTDGQQQPTWGPVYTIAEDRAPVTALMWSPVVCEWGGGGGLYF